MNLFWKFFWKITGAALGLLVLGGCIWALYAKSAEVFYQTIQLAFAVTLGGCGIIGLIVVPFELYIEDRKGRRKQDASQ